MANGIYKITEDFEKALSDYTGSPYVVTLDNMSNGLFLALYYEHKIKNKTEKIITIPSRTYPSVPCEIIHAGLKVGFEPVEGRTIKGAYQLKGSNVWDSALRFTADMYIPNTHMCISFTMCRLLYTYVCFAIEHACVVVIVYAIVHRFCCMCSEVHMNMVFAYLHNFITLFYTVLHGAYGLQNLQSIPRYVVLQPGFAVRRHRWSGYIVVC